MISGLLLGAVGAGLLLVGIFLTLSIKGTIAVLPDNSLHLARFI